MNKFIFVFLVFERFFISFIYLERSIFLFLFLLIIVVIIVITKKKLLFNKKHTQILFILQTQLRSKRTKRREVVSQTSTISARLKLLHHSKGIINIINSNLLDLSHN